MAPRVVIVSNRSPVTVTVDGASVRVESSTGGLATGLRGPHERGGGVWVGWPGCSDDMTPAQAAIVEQRLAELRIAPVSLSNEDVRDYYEGVANGVLWPVFHSLVGLLPLELPDFAAYRRINERFAEATVAHARHGDAIWVHDYQLMLVPALVRERLPDATIGFFLHIPFPAVDIFRSLPFAGEVLRGLLGADLIGFHAPSYMRHFAAAVTRVLGVPSGLEGIGWGDRTVRLGVFPMGIDVQHYAGLGRDEAIMAEAGSLRQGGAMQLLVGIDRLDYTKGIPRRLLAYERLLLDHPELKERVQLIQAAVPSRTGVEAYQALREQVNGLVGRINGAFATASWTPVQYLFRPLGARELVALYLAADAMLVTPLRDGMNLVAKEFVAARHDEGGVLVLSEFTGAATELGEALLVNPYDIGGTAAMYHRALTMSDAERGRRMRALRRRVTTYDVHRWVRVFLSELRTTASTRRQAVPRQSPPEVFEAIVERARTAPRVALLLDYDGTLVPFAPTPDLAVADRELIALLAALGADPRFDVSVVSGRSRETLERWLGALPVTLHAEHGAWSRPAGKLEWTALDGLACPWREAVQAVLEDFAARTPGAFVEEKTFGLAWHYRLADPDYGTSQANELRVHLTALLANDPVQVLSGEKVIEVRPHALHKGRVVDAVLERAGEAALVLAIGDDTTDEDLFAALPADAVAIHVGPSTTRAGARVRDVAAVRRFLESLLHLA